MSLGIFKINSQSDKIERSNVFLKAQSLVYTVFSHKRLKNMEDENDYKFPPCLRKTAFEFWNSPRNFNMGMDFLGDSTDEESECDTIAYDNEDPDVDFKHLSTICIDMLHT